MIHQPEHTDMQQQVIIQKFIIKKRDPEKANSLG